ncbi:MAG: FeoA family protein [Proteobacteria bacterium]|nr:FeoA family protein [Pseudomonadota bacterium]
MRLTDLAVGDLARVTGYVAYAAQLMYLGLIPGTEFRLNREAPLGDPVEIRYRGFSLCLRPTEADCLEVERV